MYCKYSEIGIHAITWNCNMLDPDSLTLDDAKRFLSFDRDKVDLVVVCLQEMVELNSYNVILGNNESIT